jgi:hypothetical protein
MTLTARVRSGEALRLVDFDGKHFRLMSGRAFAPGQPLWVELELGGGLSLELKSLGSVRRGEGEFEVRARASTLSRPAREALHAQFKR